MSNVDDPYGQQLLFVASEMQDALKTEMDGLTSQLSHSLARHLAKAVSATCNQLYSENVRLTQQLKSGQFSQVSPQEIDRESLQQWALEEYLLPQLCCQQHASQMHDSSTEVIQQIDSIRVATPVTRNQTMFPEVSKGVGATGTRSCGVLGSISFMGRNNSWSAQVVSSKYFDAFFHVVICINCITMGIDAEQIARGLFGGHVKMLIAIADNLYTVLFTMEFFLKLHVFGWRAFFPCLSICKDATWNLMDGILVIFAGILYQWMFPLVALVAGFDSQNDIVRALSLLGALRLLRLVRVLHRAPAFREAWLLLRGMTDSARTLFWTCAVICLVTYIFAIFGIMLIAQSLSKQRDSLDARSPRHEELTDLLDHYVGGVDVLMSTLFQVLTLDSWNSIVRRLKQELPWCWLYFYLYVAVAVFLVMNLVTAIIVESALLQAKSDEDQKLKERESIKRKELKDLEELFNLMDEDGSGTLSWPEFESSFHDLEMTKKWRLLDFEPDECRELFGLLDDGDGEIATNEFFDGLAKMKGLAQSKDIFRLEKLLSALMISGVRGSARDSVVAVSNPLSTGDSSRSRGKKRLATTVSPKKVIESEEAKVAFLTTFQNACNEFLQQDTQIEHDLILEPHVEEHFNDKFEVLPRAVATTIPKPIGEDVLPEINDCRSHGRVHI
mmetsp:Transcript_87104/g.136322  ORF Transcript_87104/g.136322 Transcript_87104/m.136322 type:complete len:670 (-) Transcript_87104:66-2075(-)